MIRRPEQFRFRIPDPVALLALAMIVAAAAAGAMEPPPHATGEPLNGPPMQVEAAEPGTKTLRERLGIRLSLFRHG